MINHRHASFSLAAQTHVSLIIRLVDNNYARNFHNLSFRYVQWYNNKIVTRVDRLLLYHCTYYYITVSIIISSKSFDWKSNKWNRKKKSNIARERYFIFGTFLTCLSNSKKIQQWDSNYSNKRDTSTCECKLKRTYARFGIVTREMHILDYV